MLFYQVFRLTARKMATVILTAIASTGNAATIVVNTHTDGVEGAGKCELRSAILAANSDAPNGGCPAGNGADRIVFNFLTPAFGILLNSDLPQITESLEIAGPGSDKLYIDGDDSRRILDVSFLSGAFTLRDIQLYQGVNTTGGCLTLQSVPTILIEDVRIESCASSSGNGGGVYISASGGVGGVTIRRASLINNRSIGTGGGMRAGGTNIVIEDSTFSDNTAIQNTGVGGALTLGGAGPSTVRRSTFWNNSAKQKASAIHNFALNHALTISHSTISNNHLTGTLGADIGGAITGFGSITLFNTIVAGNTESNTNHTITDLNTADGGAMTSGGFNLIGNNSGAATEFPAGVQANGDRIGTFASPLDPALGSLADNGGPTRTAMPAQDSVVIDRGSCPGQLTDQRGYQNLTKMVRIIDAPGVADADDGCDIGAVEYQAQQTDPLFEDSFEDYY